MFLSSDGVAAPGRRPGFSLRLGLGRGGGREGVRTSGAAGAMAPNFPVATVGGRPSGGPACFLFLPSRRGRGSLRVGLDELFRAPAVRSPVFNPSPPSDPAFPASPSSTPFFQTPAARPPTTAVAGDRRFGPVPPGAGSKPMARAGRGPSPPAAPTPSPLGARALPASRPGCRAHALPGPAPPPGTRSPVPQPAPTPHAAAHPRDLQSRVANLRLFLPRRASVSPPRGWGELCSQIWPWPCLRSRTRPVTLWTPHPSWETSQACRAAPTEPLVLGSTAHPATPSLNPRCPSGRPKQGWDMGSPRPEALVPFLSVSPGELQHRHFLRGPFPTRCLPDPACPLDRDGFSACGHLPPGLSPTEPYPVSITSSFCSQPSPASSTRLCLIYLQVLQT